MRVLNILKISVKNKKGFSLLEMLIAMFISTLIIITVVAAFASAFRARENAGNIQRNVEDAKTALEYMAKVIRMSSNLKPVAAGTSTTAIYMYNKSLNKCISFSFSSASDDISEISCIPLSADDPCTLGDASNFVADCNGAQTSTKITDNDLNDASFYVQGSAIKRVTIRMQMLQDLNAGLQTTVSLRDYRDVNPMAN